MGYYSSQEGSFEVFPAPARSLFNRERWLNGDRDIKWGAECIEVEFETDSVTTVEEDGSETTKTRTLKCYIKACGLSGHKHYYTARALQALVDQLGHKRDYRGHFHLQGEDGVQWRFVVRNGVVLQLDPVITWPES